MDSVEIIDQERTIWRAGDRSDRYRDYPYRVELRLDAQSWDHFRRTTQDDTSTRIIEIDNTMPDIWTVIVGCSTEELARRYWEAY